MEMFEDVATYLLAAPVAASLGLAVALGVWLIRSRPPQARVRARNRRRTH
jgi:hypothetical protein